MRGGRHCLGMVKVKAEGALCGNSGDWWDAVSLHLREEHLGVS